MAINRAQLVKELVPGLHALFGLEYDSYENQHEEIFDTESSERAFEEEVMLSGFGEAPTKGEGAAVIYDTAQESFTSRYTHETIALAFALTEEAIEDNLYDTLSSRYTRALARSMNTTKQVKAANVLNNAFNSSFVGGDGKELCATDHPTVGNIDLRNELSTAADLNETSLEQSLIDIADFKDERGLKINAQAVKLIIPPALQFVADRLMESPGRINTSDNDINAIRNMGMVPQGYVVNNYLTDTDAFFIKTDVPNGLKHFVRTPVSTSMEGDFETGNVRYKARERYSFGFSDWRGIFGSPGA
jgi:phage major head subunit gpT-like protein|tara:strand:- start:157 stop:1065 length:909 start_codon:yes stop_codon:yes gene_type:complete